MSFEVLKNIYLQRAAPGTFKVRMLILWSYILFCQSAHCIKISKQLALCEGDFRAENGSPVNPSIIKIIYLIFVSRSLTSQTTNFHSRFLSTNTSHTLFMCLLRFWETSNFHTYRFSKLVCQSYGVLLFNMSADYNFLHLALRLQSPWEVQYFR